MIQPVNSEAMFQALFTLLSQIQTGSPPANVFTTASRRLPPVANIAAANQPALYMLESEEDVAETENGLPIEEHKVAAIVLFKNSSSQTAVMSTQLNTLRDLVVNQLRNFTLDAQTQTAVVPMPPGTRQTLGGLVYHCRIKGKVLKNEGLQNQQGAIVFPISILAGL